MPNSHDFRAVLFDVGGVLVELGGVTTILSWLGNRLTSDELLTRWLTSPAVRRFETGCCEPAVFAAEIVRELALSVSPDDFISAFASWPRGPMPGALELLDRLPRRYIRATLCNTNSLHWPRYLEEMRLGPAFDCHFPSHLTARIKPDAAAFEHVVATLGCRPADILFLDDSRLNVEAAQHAGMHAVQVRGVTAAQAALAAMGVLPQ